MKVFYPLFSYLKNGAWSDIEMATKMATGGKHEVDGETIELITMNLKKKSLIEIDYNDLDKLIEAAYGGVCELVAL